MPLFQSHMEQSIGEIEEALGRLNQGSPWDDDMKISEQFFEPLFTSFYEKGGMSGVMPKSDYHFLVEHIEPTDIDEEVIQVLDAIVEVAEDATPLQ